MRRAEAFDWGAHSGDNFDWRGEVPTISMFFGMIVQMYWRDHAPPHFHVLYNDFEASVSIATGEMIEGKLPPTARRLVKDWALRHRPELLANWERGRNRKPFYTIRGYDEDE